MRFIPGSGNLGRDNIHTLSDLLRRPCERREIEAQLHIVTERQTAGSRIPYRGLESGLHIDKETQLFRVGGGGSECYIKKTWGWVA